MRKLMVATVLLGLAFSSSMSPAGASSAAAPYCGIRWGSLPEADPAYTTAPITNVRAGRHACFDRAVVDLGAPADLPVAQGSGYLAQYVAQVTRDGSGDAVPLAGGAFIEVVVHAMPVDAITGAITYAPADPAHLVNVLGFRTFRQVAWAGAFEGQTTIGLGVRARLPFRVFLLAGPGSGSRLVIDVAHRW